MNTWKVLIWAVALNFAALPAAFAQFKWGANGHPLASYPGATIQQQLDLLKDMGMTSYRVDISNTNQINGVAQLVAEGKARGIEILPLLTPAVNLDSQSTNDIYNISYNLAYSFVNRFKGDIRVWELGNEMENYAIIKPCEYMDNGQQWGCQYGDGEGDDPLEYHGGRWAKVSAALKGMSDGAVDADSGVRKAMGTAGWGHTGAFARMQQDGIRWDITVWHWYSDETGLLWALPQLKNYGKPIWITEMNHNSGSANDGEQGQADGLNSLMNIILRHRATYNIEAAHIYELLDEPYWADYEAHMGLVRVNSNGSGGYTLGGVKAAYNTVKSVIAAGGGGAPAPQPPSSGSSTTFVNRNSQRCVDVPSNSTSSGTELVQWDCNSQNNQRFEPIDLGGGVMQFKAVHSGLCLEANGTGNGSRIRQVNCASGTDRQRFVVTTNGDGSSTMKLESFNMCMEIAGGSAANGANVQIYGCNGSDAQKFTTNISAPTTPPPTTPPPTTPPPTTGDSTTFVNKNSGKCVDVPGNSTSSGTELVQWDCNNQNNQNFQAIALGGGVTQFKAVHSGLCLEAAGTGNSSRIRQVNCSSGTDRQRFVVTSNGDGSSTMKLESFNMCLEIAGSSTANGGNVQIYGCNGSNAQRFTTNISAPTTPPPTTPPPETGGTTSFVNRNSGKCVDVPGNSTSSGTELLQWTCNNQPNQSFQAIGLGGGVTQFKAVHSGLCLEATGTGNSSRIRQVNCSSGTDRQRFLVTKNNDGSSTLKLESYNMCMDIDGGSANDGAIVQIYTCNGSNAQKFTTTGILLK